jgi:sulfate adenylyltransferase
MRGATLRDDAIAGGSIGPHGGALVELTVGPERAARLKQECRSLPEWDLTPRQLCDLELLSTGAFSPLDRFMTRDDYESVCDSMRLPDGTLWPVPVTLDVAPEIARRLQPGSSLVLRDAEGVALAVLRVEDLWRPDRVTEAEQVYGTTDRVHPGVGHLLRLQGTWAIGGRIETLQLPAHHDFQRWRLTPRQLRSDFAASGWRRVLAFQTGRAIHRAQHRLTLQAAAQMDANLLIHGCTPATTAGDTDHVLRARCYEVVLGRFPRASTKLALLPLAPRMAGLRETIWRAILAKNHGCTHVMVDADAPGAGSAAKKLNGMSSELGVTIVPCPSRAGVKGQNLSDTEVRQRLAAGATIPGWFTFPEVARELRRALPSRAVRGVTIFFTGLSGSGKSTIAGILAQKLAGTGRRVTLLDGDVVRKHLSSELGFSKAHRDLNIRRIGYVASEITRHGGIAICAPIAPYQAVRDEVRRLIEPLGGFALIYLSTPLEVCEQRDRKGLYAKARAGLVEQFTGISDPYEVPADATLVINTVEVSAEAAADSIVQHLALAGHLEARFETA